MPPKFPSERHQFHSYSNSLLYDSSCFLEKPQLAIRPGLRRTSIKRRPKITNWKQHLVIAVTSQQLYQNKVSTHHQNQMKPKNTHSSSLLLQAIIRALHSLRQNQSRKGLSFNANHLNKFPLNSKTRYIPFFS